jgi:hypothetical protein
VSRRSTMWRRKLRQLGGQLDKLEQTLPPMTDRMRALVMKWAKKAAA